MVTASGNLAVGGQQFWFGPNLGWVTITLWPNTTVVHLMRDGRRLKTVPSRLTPGHLRQLLADGGRPAGPPPLPTGDGQGTAVEVDRLVNAQGLVSIAGHQCPVGYHYAGHRITIRLDGGAMHLLDLDPRGHHAWLTTRTMPGGPRRWRVSDLGLPSAQTIIYPWCNTSTDTKTSRVIRALAFDQGTRPGTIATNPTASLRR